jgi:hypothetical protein
MLILTNLDAFFCFGKLMPDGFALFHRICSLAFEGYVIIFWMAYRWKNFSFTFLTVSFQGTELFLKIYQPLI